MWFVSGIADRNGNEQWQHCDKQKTEIYNYNLKGELEMALVKFNGNKGVDQWMNDFFSPMFNDSFVSDRFISRVPAVNVAETSDAYLVELAAPGLEKEDFKINVD